ALIALCCGVRLSKQGLTVLVVGGLASLYVLGVGLLTRASIGRIFGDIQAAYIVQGGEPWAQVHHALLTALGDSRLLVFGIISTLTAWVFAPPGLARRFAVICPLAALLALLNPYTAGWISANVTGPAYWRSTWAFPLPVLMTLVL